MAVVAQPIGPGRIATISQAGLAITRKNGRTLGHPISTTRNGAITKRTFKEEVQRQLQIRIRGNTSGSCFRCYAGIGGAAGGLHGMMEGLEFLYNGLVLGVGVGLPCQVMACGDAIHRSTLPKEGLILTAPGVILTLLVMAYLWAKPGVAPGFWDMFVLAKLERFIRPNYNKEDFTLGKKLGEGAFGTVYRATFAEKKSKKYDNLVVKKANEYGAVEIWMNERVRRACSKACADFVDGFRERLGKGKEEFWLVWGYEGDATLDTLMADKNFPYNVEKLLLGNDARDLPKDLERENKIIRTIMRQIVSAVASLHSTGIIHRDIKPQNIIFSEDSKMFKIIDLGAAADLRVGINYVPNEFLLDPRYAAPEQYIMSTQTPSAPNPAVATALSPVLWKMNVPDRFDVYSAGLIFLQMAFPNLRTDSALITFNRQLKRCEYDLALWREQSESRGNADVKRGFEILDMDDRAGWELLQAMVRFKGRTRISADQVLAHPYFARDGLFGASFLQKLRLQLLRARFQDSGDAFAWVSTFLSKSGSKDVGGFTEAELQKLRKESKKKNTAPRNALAAALRLKRNVDQTVAETTAPSEAGGKNRRKNIWWNRWETETESS